ncbi:hypothetical protein [Streptomyces sp. ALB3]|uniref:hypothetical protein n=1 Tax=Streptomyces sp. ALB3 TaxID=3374278 RepID=UPI00379F20E3
MTNRIGHTTETASTPQPRLDGTPEAAAGTTPVRTPVEGPGAGTPAGKGLGPKSAGPGDLSVPPAPRTAPAAPSTEPAGRHGAAGTDRPLIPRDEQDALSLRMQQAVTDFVEDPRRAVESADNTFDRIVSSLTEALAERSRVLRASWQEQDTDAQTEELRLALQRYRDISEQLLRI